MTELEQQLKKYTHHTHAFYVNGNSSGLTMSQPTGNEDVEGTM